MCRQLDTLLFGFQMSQVTGKVSFFSQFTASHGHASCQVSCPGNKLLEHLAQKLVLCSDGF